MVKRNRKGERSDCRHRATTRHMTRIISYLNEIDSANYTKIRECTGITSPRLSDALTFMIKYKIVFVLKKSRGTSFYVLSHDFRNGQ